tara:strand:+ start:10385 stop:12739 length:2355 start_codon:yes stop_codon:yes gene_type:complete
MKLNFKILFTFVFPLCFNINAQQIDLNNLPENIRSQIEDLSKEDIQEIPTSELVDQNFLNEGDSETEFNAETSKKFGFNYFNNRPEVNSEVLDIPLGSEYRINYGDTLEVLLLGEVNEIYKIPVDLSGSILIPDVGKITVQNLSLNDVEDKLNNLIQKKYLQTTASLSISEASLKKISVIGSVKSPGTYVVNPFTSISESISYAGGLEEEASLRNIIIKNIQGEEVYLDLYDFLLTGERDVDITLRNGDTVIINSTDQYTEITGQVLREGLYEFKKDDTYKDLIEYALGFASYANKENIFATYINGNQLLNKKVNLDDQVGDIFLTEIYIGKKDLVRNKMVFVSGDAVTDGYYEYDENQLLTQVLNKLVFSREIYPFYALLRHETDLGIYYESFSLGDLSTYSDIKLKNNPEIYFFDRDQVIKLFSFTENQLDEKLLDNQNDSLTDFNSDEKKLKSKNNLDEKNLPHELIAQSDMIPLIIGEVNLRVPIVGRVNPKILYEYFGLNADIVTEAVTIKTEAEVIENAYEYVIDAAEVSFISMPNDDDDVFLVTISGQVENPGRYLVQSNTTINDIYKIAGGLKPNASESGIVFTRTSIKKRELEAIEDSREVLSDILLANVGNPLQSAGVNFDVNSILELANNIEPVGRLVGNFAPNSLLSISTTLEEGDAVFVPSSLNSVSIIGEVLNPITTSVSQNLTVEDYLELSGGVTDFADVSNIFIIEPSGNSYLYKNNLFTKQIYLNPGDTIVVPRNLEKLSPIPAISIAANILSDIAFAAASLNSLSN